MHRDRMLPPRAPSLSQLTPCPTPPLPLTSPRFWQAFCLLTVDFYLVGRCACYPCPNPALTDFSIALPVVASGRMLAPAAAVAPAPVAAAPAPLTARRLLACAGHFFGIGVAEESATRPPPRPRTPLAAPPAGPFIIPTLQPSPFTYIPLYIYLHLHNSLSPPLTNSRHPFHTRTTPASFCLLAHVFW